MYLRVEARDGAPAVEIAEPDDFTRFHIVVVGDLDLDRTLRAADTGWSDGDGDHAFVRIDALERFLGDAASAGWQDGFAAMVGYATSKGWASDDGAALRAHVERETPRS